VKKALVTGITGQDGPYLADFLLEKGYQVHGIIRRSSSFNTARIMHVFQDKHVENPHLILHYGDITDSGVVSKLIDKTEPDEVYNLAAQSHVRISFDMPIYTVNSIALGTLHLLEAIKNTRRAKNIRYYQASSSEMYGNAGAPFRLMRKFPSSLAALTLA